MTTDQDTDGGNKHLSLNIRLDRSESQNVMIYSPYWIVNKTGLPLQLKVNLTIHSRASIILKNFSRVVGFSVRCCSRNIRRRAFVFYIPQIAKKDYTIAHLPVIVVVRVLVGYSRLFRISYMQVKFPHMMLYSLINVSY
jgi:hypothetical protein